MQSSNKPLSVYDISLKFTVDTLDEAEFFEEWIKGECNIMIHRIEEKVKPRGLVSSCDFDFEKVNI